MINNQARKAVQSKKYEERINQIANIVKKKIDKEIKLEQFKGFDEYAEKWSIAYHAECDRRAIEAGLRVKFH